MKVPEFIKEMRSFEGDHKPEGWPAIQMKDISNLCDIIERQREVLEDICCCANVWNEKEVAIAHEALEMEV